MRAWNGKIRHFYIGFSWGINVSYLGHYVFQGVSVNASHFNGHEEPHTAGGISVGREYGQWDLIARFGFLM